jgi:hypothetical protein
MVKPKGYFSKAAKAARSAAYRSRVESRRMMMSGMFKRKYVRSGKYKGRGRIAPAWMRNMSL